MRKCLECGRPAVFGTCDECWERALRQTADRHAEAIAKREKTDGC